MNSVCISGYIRRIGQVRQVSGDTKVVDIVVSMKKASAREEQKYDNIRCACWRGQAEYIEKYATEGEYAVVQGQLSTRSYEDKDGKKIYETFVTVTDLQIPRTTDKSAIEKENKAINEDGYLDVGKTSARKVNNIYRQDENDLELPF